MRNEADHQVRLDVLGRLDEHGPRLQRPLHLAELVFDLREAVDNSITGLTALTVTSSASATASGKTALTVSGYTLKSGEGWKYKVTTGTAASVLPGEVVSGWTAWNGSDEITAATDKKLALVAVNKAGQAIAYGSCTVTAKA